jgi:hypothetical protein
MLIMQANDPEAFFTEYDAAKERHSKDLLNKVDFDALKSRASELHDNVKCYIPTASLYDPEKPVPEAITNQTGGQNCNLDIKFEDGVIWIVRLRFEDPTILPRAAQQAVSTSEVATLKYLADETRLRVPKVLHHCFDESEIGIPYILMEKLSGKPLDWSEASLQQRTKVMEQLVDVFLELEKHPFSKTGSLLFRDGTVGPFAQHHMFVSPSE